MKNHSREDITDRFENINDCVVHKCKPVIMDIVAGRRKEHHYVAVCKSDDCTKLTTDPDDRIVQIWNKWNPVLTDEQKQIKIS